MRARVVGIVIWILLGTGVFFTIEVERMRSELRHTGGADFKDGERVIALKAIDGDELSVQDSKGEKARVRLLGIKTFSPARTNPYEGRYGKQAFEFLKKLQKSPLVLTLNKPPRDKRGRVLAFAELADDDGYDIGKRMIERGIAVAYTRYGHAREAEYIKAEEAAVARQAGLWGDGKVAQRVRDLKRQWFLERSKDE
jgi:endonuclease YncB( thermonuclease family)